MSNKSTSLCLFGYDPVFVRGEEGWIEYDSIFNSKNRGNSYRPTIGQSSIFWRSLIRRQWQYDDFKFPYMAAASYVANAHRHRIHFNPFEMYKAGMCWEAGIGKNCDDPKLLKKLEDDAWKDAVETGVWKGQETEMTMASFGWDPQIAIVLEECAKKGEWTESGWKLWTELISKNIHLSHNLVAVMMHEVQHVISQHLVRLNNRNKILWNIATDFSINQHLPFSTNWARNLITFKNKNFQEKMDACICKWLCSTDKNVCEKMKEMKLYPDSDLELFRNNLVSLIGFLKDGTLGKHKFINKTADFYYEVYRESNAEDCMGEFSESGGNHENWEEGLSFNKESEGVGEQSEKSESEDKGDSFEESEEKSKGEDSSTSEKKDRGDGAAIDHPGFNRSVARNEAKNGVRRALEAAGYDCNSEEDIERALKNIPSVGGIGAVIEEWFGVKKANWKRKLSTEMKWSMNATSRDYTMKREHRAVDGVFPGKTLQLGLEIIIGLDTSGSIQHEDWNDFVNQVEYIAKDCDVIKTRMIQCHSHIAFDEMVKLKRVKFMGIKETGGTRMKVIAEKLKREKNRKSCILFTDGYIDFFKQEDYSFKIIIFLSRGNSCNKEILEKRGFKVICQDDE